jgi:hypothetical protein
MNTPLPSCSGPQLSRRQMLQVGAASVLGLGLPQLLRAETRRASADSCIIIFLNGGPPQLDMWDMKPDAPPEIRGPFKPMPTTVPGLQICELLPRMAQVMHHATVVRSMHHSVNNAHAAAVYCGLTGHDRGELGGGAKPTDHPSIGSVTGMLRPPTRAVVPYVSLPYITAEGAGGPPQPGFTGGWLGKTRDPLWILRNPNAPDFGMPELTLGPDIDPTRFDIRRALIGNLDQPHHSVDRQLADLEGIRSKAFDLLTSPAMQQAVRIDRESPKLRDAYGRNIYGQSTLLARRMIEAGCRVATLSWAPDANATWDTHGNNFNKLKNELLPQLDMAVGTLLNDLHDRGLLERTVVAIMGEFGRTPKVNAAAGRDHWNFCYSLMLAGGGIRGGMVYGASDKIASRPSLNPVTPADIVATIYACLGISADHELRDRLDRPTVVVPWGKPIAEIM